MKRVTSVAVCVSLCAGVGACATAVHKGAQALSPPPAVCHAQRGGLLPDPMCTPGATDPNVNMSNMNMTICAKGWASRHRPPLAVTEPLKRKLVRRYGSYAGVSLRNYELDHLVPIELGGSELDVANLWPQAHPQSFRKDKVENRLHREVCAGRVTLSAAQGSLEADWTTAG